MGWSCAQRGKSEPWTSTALTMTAQRACSISFLVHPSTWACSVQWDATYALSPNPRKPCYATKFYATTEHQWIKTAPPVFDAHGLVPTRHGYVVRVHTTVHTPWHRSLGHHQATADSYPQQALQECALCGIQEGLDWTATCKKQSVKMAKWSKAQKRCLAERTSNTKNIASSAHAQHESSMLVS